MTRKGPLFTLLGGGALAAVLLAASVNAAAGDDEQQNVAGESAPATEAATAPPTATPPPEEPEEVEPLTYVGYVDGGGASVAIVVNGTEATAYVCNGSEIEAWFNGPAVNQELLLDAENGELIGSFDDAEAEGETVVDGQTWTFHIEHVEAPEGLYRFADTVVGGAEVEGGWIVLPDGTQVGITTVDGVPQPAPALDLRTGEVVLEDSTVTVDRVG